MKKKASRSRKKSVDNETKTYNFFEDVYEVVKLIPRGRVTSYGAIARYLGTGMSARMVGWAMHAVRGNSPVPAHRVVNSQGLLTGRVHFKPPSSMQRKLEREGIKIVNNQVQDFPQRLWDPTRELGL